MPPMRDASKLSIRLQGDPLTRVARGTAAHPARSRLRHRGPASDQAAQKQRSVAPEARRSWTRLHRERQADGKVTAGSWPGRRPGGGGGRLRGLYPPTRAGARVGQGQGATRSNSGQDHDLPELPGQRTAPWPCPTPTRAGHRPKPTPPPSRAQPSDGNADGNRGAQQGTSTHTHGQAGIRRPAKTQMTTDQRAHVLCAGGGHASPGSQLQCNCCGSRRSRHRVQC